MSIHWGLPKTCGWFVRKMIHDGGLVIASTYVIEPDVPWGNVVSLFEACFRFGEEPAA